MNIWVIPATWLLQNKLLWVVVYKRFCEYMFLFLLGKQEWSDQILWYVYV